MSVQIIRVDSRSLASVVRIDRRPDGAQVVPVLTNIGSGSGERWWSGEGPPPDLIVGARMGDWYWDVITGNVYELTVGV